MELIIVAHAYSSGIVHGCIYTKDHKASDPDAAYTYSFGPSGFSCAAWLGNDKVL